MNKPKAGTEALLLYSLFFLSGVAGLGYEIVWTRMLNAFEERERALLFYVARKSSAGLRDRADTLLSVYQDPSTLPRQSLPADDPLSSDIVSHGLAYLARYNPSRALSYWNDYRERMAFSDAQVDRVESAIALHALFAREAASGRRNASHYDFRPRQALGRAA